MSQAADTSFRIRVATPRDAMVLADIARRTYWAASRTDYADALGV